MSLIRRSDRNIFKWAEMALAVCCALLAGTAGQSRARERPGPNLTQLKRAVVIVTTLDSDGKPLLQGSGFFVASDRVVTNLHVIKGAGRILIQMFDGLVINVRDVVAVNENDDLALLQIDSPKNHATILPLADSAAIEGQPVLLISNPRGFQWKPTQGRVGRSWDFKGTGKRIQITASILPGSSGGPVLNNAGEVVGVAVMHFDSTDKLNFAVPAQRLKALQATTTIATLRAAPGNQPPGGR